MDSNSDASDALSDNLVRTSEKYDALPYESRPIVRAHPARLAAMARLFGIDIPDVPNARILELGCAAGGNLIPFAMFNPGSHSVGIDIGLRQIEDGRRRVSELGLENVELIHASITDIGDELGEFDFIISHGVYSWVPAPVREKILEISKRNLSPNGIAYISYNVLPGWRLLQPMRDILRLMVPADLPPIERAARGRQAFEYMAKMTPDVGPYSELLRLTRSRVLAFSDTYLFHEYMEEVNEPQTFMGFAADAGRHGLAYLGESEITSMLPDRYGEEFVAEMNRSAPDDVVGYGQMLDALTGTQFRTSLLVHECRHDAISRSFTPDRLRELHFAPTYVIRYREEGDTVILSDAGVADRHYDDPLIVLLLRRLFSHAPASRTFAELVDGLGPDDAQNAMVHVKNMLVGGLLMISTEPMQTGEAGEKPVANPLARADAAAGRNETASRIHVGVNLGDMSPLLVARLDGTMDRAAIEAFVKEHALAGRIEVRNEQGETPAPHEIDDAVRTYVRDGLRTIAGHGLIEP